MFECWLNQVVHSSEHVTRNGLHFDQRRGNRFGKNIQYPGEVESHPNNFILRVCRKLVSKAEFNTNNAKRNITTAFQPVDEV